MEKKNNPQVRFKGFDEDWKKSEFDTVFNGISNNSLSREMLNYHSGNAKNIHYGDVLVKFNEIVDVEKEVIPFISDNKIVEKLKNSRLLDGDIIISDAAEDEMVGKCVEMINIKDNIVLSGLHTIAVRPKQKFAPRYLGYYMNSDSYHNQLLKLMQGTKVLSISKTAVKKTFVNHPNNENEQSQLGTFFKNLDKLITEHQQKHNKLKALKKAMLSKMFPQQGQTIPEIRFKGYTGEWVEKNLSELSTYSNGKGNESNQLSAGKYELINLNSISIDGGLKPSGKFINHADSTLNKNDIVMVLSDVGNGDLLGRVALIPVNDKYVLNQRVALLRPNKDISPYFLYYNINTNQLYFKSQGAGMSQLNLSKKSVEDFTSLIPKEINEQISIAQYLNNIDNLISNHKTQINKLQNIKKAFLAKMFI